MNETIKINLCRICLESGASFPLFGNDEDENHNIHSKLLLCLKEEIEDIEGYPRNICETCNNILNETYNLINKYKNTCRILENGLEVLKKEKFEFNFSDNEHSEPEIEIENFIKEYNSEETEFSDHIDVSYEPIKIKIKLEKGTSKIIKKRNYRTNTKQITNKVASSVLEGEFSWNGDKWCLNSGSTKEQLKISQNLITTEKSKGLRIKIPKVKKPNPPKLCDLCGKVFKTADKLLTHKKRVHFRNPVKCSLCPRMLSTNYCLMRHMKRSHGGEKTFICSICGRGFAFKGELSTHDRNVHKKHLKRCKEFKCQFCNKIYKCAKSVVIHERSIHTGQRPAVCSVCGSSFYHEDYLKEHMRLHTGETPFKCPICGRGYAQRCNMKSHLRIHRVSEIDATILSKLRPNYLRLLKA